jgi:alpha-L-fucosidase 2
MMALPNTQMPRCGGRSAAGFCGPVRGHGIPPLADLDTAITSTRFNNGAIQYKREVFASAPDQVIVVRLSATGGVMNFDLGYRHPLETNYGVTDYTGAKTATVAAPMPWNYRESVRAAERPSSLSVRADGGDALLIEGRNVAAPAFRLRCVTRCVYRRWVTVTSRRAKTASKCAARPPSRCWSQQPPATSTTPT